MHTASRTLLVLSLPTSSRTTLEYNMKELIYWKALLYKRVYYWTGAALWSMNRVSPSSSGMSDFLIRTYLNIADHIFVFCIPFCLSTHLNVPIEPSNAFKRRTSNSRIQFDCNARIEVLLCMSLSSRDIPFTAAVTDFFFTRPLTISRIPKTEFLFINLTTFHFRRYIVVDIVVLLPLSSR